MKKLLEEKAKVEDNIRNFKLDPEYRNERQIQKLIKTLSEIQTLATALNESNKTPSETDEIGELEHTCCSKSKSWSVEHFNVFVPASDDVKKDSESHEDDGLATPS